DQRAMPGKLGFEARERGVVLALAHARRERAPAGLARRQDMGLQCRYDLQLVLDIAQKEVGGGQLARAAAVQVTQSAQALERGQGFGRAQPWITSAIDQDQRLGDELEFADAAIAELDIARDQVRRAQLAFDLMFHRPQLAQGLEIQVAAKDKMAQLWEQPLTDFDCSGHRSSAQQRSALPGLAEALIKIERAGKWCDQRSAAASRP